MQLHSHAWEHALISLAHEAGQANENQAVAVFDRGLLEQAYNYCKAITAHHSRSFYMASGLLPPDTRRAVRALYAFCRISDDIVDTKSSGDELVRSTQLEEWRAVVMSSTPPNDELVAVAWTDARLRYKIPVRYAEQLIDGVAQDLTPRRYKTFNELAAYAYCVASTVGLMSMHIIGYQSNAAIPYAIKLGVALQLTNILRDVGEDLRNGRVYLPQDELEAFGICEQQMKHGVSSGRWREFMKFQIARNRALYEEAMPGIGLLDAEGRFAIAAAAHLYRAILTDIEQYDYNVFHRRAGISQWDKLRRLPTIWWHTVIAGGK